MSTLSWTSSPVATRPRSPKRFRRVIHLKLHDYESALAVALGHARRGSAVDGGRPGRYGYDEDDPLRTDINAAGGELAAMVVYGLPWSGCYYRTLSPKPADLGTGTEVRTCRVHPSRTVETMRLILHDEDRDDWRAVLVVGDLPDYWVIGDVNIGWAKQKQWWVDPVGGRGAYFVPQSEICPAESLSSRANRSRRTLPHGSVSEVQDVRANAAADRVLPAQGHRQVSHAMQGVLDRQVCRGPSGS